jgi:hypothetical protein
MRGMADVDGRADRGTWNYRFATVVGRAAGRRILSRPDGASLSDFSSLRLSEVHAPGWLGVKAR